MCVLSTVTYNSFLFRKNDSSLGKMIFNGFCLMLKPYIAINLYNYCIALKSIYGSESLLSLRVSMPILVYGSRVPFVNSLNSWSSLYEGCSIKSTTLTTKTEFHHTINIIEKAKQTKIQSTVEKRLYGFYFTLAIKKW